MDTTKVRLNICGSSYVVSTTESDAYMQNLAERLNLDMTELISSSASISVTTAAILTALGYRDELEKASGTVNNMRSQFKNYLEDAASSKMAAEELRRENAALKAQLAGLQAVPSVKPELENARREIVSLKSQLAAMQAGTAGQEELRRENTALRAQLAAMQADEEDSGAIQ